MALTLRTGGGLLSPASAVNQNKGTNNGGLIGGVGYLGEKTALGFLSGVEGIWDYTAGGVAKLFGADKWAERQFVNDWVDYAHADEWYDPGKGWQVAGDVAGGIGTSLPAIAGVGIGALTVSLTGGAGLGIGAPIIAGSIAGLGAAGNATKEAYRKSGTLGGKEFAYGALSGATEAGIEALTAGIGTGTGRIISSLSKKAAGDTVKTLTKSGARSVIGHLAADFASEAVEEGLAEALNPIYQRLTVDPNAKNATAGEIAYAALIGGLSGLVMSGGTAAVNTMANLNSGAAAVESGTADAIIKTASQLSAYEDANDTGYDSFRNISAGFKTLSESLKSTGGQITTAKQKMLLGSLKQAETAAFIEPFVERSATNLLINAEGAAQRFTQLGMKDGDGNPLSFTAEEIRSGVDADLLARATSGQLSGSERKKFVKQLRAAMATNSALTTLAVADATGRITMDTRRFAEAAREGAEIATTADLNYFAENASADEISALADDLGIEDWASLTLEEFQAKAADYAQSERGREMSFQSKRIQEAKAAENTAAQPLPQRFGSGTPEGATHYRSEDGRMDMALIREGDRYHLYDYASGRISGEMTLGKVNALVSDYNAQAASERAERARMAEDERREKLSAVRYNGLASEHIKDWNRLSEPVKQMVRMTMRQAEAAGLSEKDVITFGRVAAHSGMNIVFSSVQSAAGDGMLRGDTIYIDPQANKDRIEKRLLVHEMAHALMKGADGWAFMNDVFYQADPEKARKVAEQYIRFYRDQGYSAEQYMPIVNEEIAAAHLEETLGSIDAWDYILKESEPSLKEKVLRFFGKSAQDYAGAEDLSSEARKLLFSYKKMFDQLAERNRGNNAVEMARADADVAGESRYAFAGEKAKTADKMKLDTAKQMIRDGKDSETVRKETGWFRGMDGKWRFEIDDSASNYFRSGDAAFSKNHPEYAEHSNLTLKFINGDITNSELTRLQELSKIWGGEKNRLSNNVRGGVATLKDMIQHDALFEAYPQLRNIRVLIENVDGGAKGEYAEKKHTIKISSKLSPKEARKTLLHEIQHAVQSIEGFTSGGNLESNRAAVEEVMNIMELTEQQRKMVSLDLLAKYSDMVKRPIYDKLLALAQKNEFNTVKEYINSLGDYSYYERIAGEVEARDVARRSDMDSEQRKNTRPDVDREDVAFADSSVTGERLALPEKHYSYETLTGKKDIPVVKLPDEVPTDDQGKIDKAAVIATGRTFARAQKNAKNTETETYVFVPDIQEDVMIRSRGLSHGLGRNAQDTASATMVIGELLKNSIAVNELNGRTTDKRKTDMSYVLLAVGQNKKSPYLVRIVVDKTTGTLSEVSTYGLYAVNAKKNGALFMPKGNEAVSEYRSYPYLRSTISIADLLENVKGLALANEIFSNDVLAKLGVERTRGTLSENVRYALPEEGSEGKKGDKKKYHMSPGQVRASVANSIHRKAYSKADARAVLGDLTGVELLNGKTQESLANYLWQGFNTCETMAERERFAKSFSTKLADKLFEVEIDNENADMYRERAQMIGEGIRGILIAGTEYADRIRKMIGASKYKDFLSDWGFKRNKTGKKAISLRQFVSQISEMPGMSHLKNMDLAEAMIEIDRIYIEALDNSHEKKGAFDDLNAAQKEQLALGFENSILKAFEQKGTQSDFSKQVDRAIGDIAMNADRSLRRMQKELDAANQRYQNTLGDDKVVINKGLAKKQQAEFKSDRVYSRVDVSRAFESIPVYNNIPSEVRSALESEVWEGLNARTTQGARELYLVDQVSNKLFQTILNEALTDERMREWNDIENQKRVAKKELVGEERKVRIKTLNEQQDSILDDHASRFTESLDQMEINRILDNAAKAIPMLLTAGRMSKKAAMETEFDMSTAGYWKREYENTIERNKVLNQLSAKAQKMKDLKLGTFSNATQMDSEVFKGVMMELSSIEYRGNLSVTKAKNALRELAKWYESEDVKSGILLYQDEENRGFFDRGIVEMLAELTETNESFTNEQLSTLLDVMSYFTKFVERYGKVYRNSRWVDAKPEAERFVKILRENEKIGLSLTERVMRTLRYLENFGDPAAVVRQMDMYQDGFYTEMYEELRAAAEDADVQLMNVMRDYDAFMKKNPRYMREAANQTVKWAEEQFTARMPKMVAISLYMTSKREQAQAGLAINGFKFEDAEGKIRRGGGILKGLEDPKKASQKAIASAMEDLRRQLRQSFTKEDMEYIKILERAYSYDLRSLKAKRDMQRQGFTNATDGYYYPIRRADSATSVDVSVFAELDRVSNASFNKNTVKGARGKLQIEDADALFHRHAKAVTQYYSLSPAIENFNVLFNMDISGNPNNSVSVATVGENQWKDAKEYFRDLIGDIQGKPKNAGGFNRILSSFRSKYAMYQLGANPKTVVTQLSSLFASSSILEPTAIMSGLKYEGKDVDQYCKLAELRHYDAAAVKAQGVLDRVGAAGELLMKPIGGMDRLVVRILWGACQVQVSKDQKLKIGTEENKVAAGKLLEQVLFETQQNSLATERSAAMRSGSEFAKAITMFSADGMKVTGRVLDGFGEVSVLKRRIKAAGEGEKEALQEQLKAAMKKARRAVAALIGSAAFGVAVAELFRWLYNKKREEDESVVLDLTGELVGNMMGGLPLFRDLYDRIVDGYEMDHLTVSMLNDLFGTFDSALDLTGKAFKGEAESTDYTSWAKQTAYVAGQFTGIPVRNIYNVLTGLTRRFSPNAGYQIDRFFYKKNYRNDLKKAIEAGDAKRVALLTGIIHGKDATGEIGEENMAELNRLAMAGYSVLPRTVSDKVTVNGEEVELAPEQAEALAEAYDERWSGAVAELMSYSVFANLDDKHKQKAIRKAHDIAYEEALLSLGMDRSERSVVLASAIGIGRAAAYYAAVSGISADVDKKGVTIEGSRRRKILEAIDSLEVRREEKLMLITVSGYSLKDGDIRGMTAEREKRLLLSYILKMSGKSASEKAAIAEMCGFEVKDGKIMRSSLVSA